MKREARPPYKNQSSKQKKVQYFPYFIHDVLPQEIHFKHPIRVAKSPFLIF